MTIIQLYYSAPLKCPRWNFLVALHHALRLYTEHATKEDVYLFHAIAVFVSNPDPPLKRVEEGFVSLEPRLSVLDFVSHLWTKRSLGSRLGVCVETIAAFVSCSWNSVQISCCKQGILQARNTVSKNKVTLMWGSNLNSDPKSSLKKGNEVPQPCSQATSRFYLAAVEQN